jgi:homocitrate synthase NifV
MNQPGVGGNAFAHESGIHADGALKDHRNYELYDEELLGDYPDDRHAHSGRIVLTGEYGGLAGFRHVMDELGIEVTDETLTFQLVQLNNAATGRPLTDDELRLTAAYPTQLALLYPGLLS